MTNDTNLQFIQEKISQLRNAVMYVNCNGLIKLRNNIVTALKVDEDGQLWFVTNQSSHIARECEQSFPVRLRFHRKGVHFFIEISGKATIVNNDYLLDNGHPKDDDGSQNSKKILMKLAMINVEYTEPFAKRQKTKLEVAIETWYNWFLRTVAVQHDSRSVLKKLRQTN